MFLVYLSGKSVRGTSVSIWLLPCNFTCATITMECVQNCQVSRIEILIFGMFAWASPAGRGVHVEAHTSFLELYKHAPWYCKLCDMNVSVKTVKHDQTSMSYKATANFTTEYIARGNDWNTCQINATQCIENYRLKGNTQLLAGHTIET